MRRILALCLTTAFTAASAAVGTPAQAASPPPIPPILSVTEMPNVKQNPVVLGRDGTYSAEINGKSYWAFNDTSMSEANASGQNFIDNTLSWSTSLDATHGIFLNKDQVDSTGVPERFIPFTDGENNFDRLHNSAHCIAQPCGASLALWPGPIVYDPASTNVIVPFVEEVRGGKIVGFHSVGGGLAVGKVDANGYFTLTRPIQNPASQTPTLMWGPHDIIFSDEAFILNGYYYAYGGKGVFVTTEDVLARVPLAQVLNKSAWTYYAGNETWSSNVADAVTLFDGSASGSSVFFDSYLNLWVAIFSGNFSNNLYYAVANAPEGPWSAATQFYTGRTGYQNDADYATRAHPEYSPDGGKTEYVTYVHTTGFLQQNLPLLKIVFGPAQ